MKKTEDKLDIVFQDGNCTLCLNSKGKYVIRGASEVIVENCDQVIIRNDDHISKGNVKYVGDGNIKCLCHGTITSLGRGNIISHGCGNIYLYGMGGIFVEPNRPIPIRNRYEGKLTRDIEDESLSWESTILCECPPEDLAVIIAQKAYNNDDKKEEVYPVAVREINGNTEPVIYHCHHIDTPYFKVVRALKAS